MICACFRVLRELRVETTAERAKLTQLALDLKIAAEETTKRNQEAGVTIGWVLFLAGFLLGLLVLIASTLPDSQLRYGPNTEST
jgi:hypothetical protein